MYTRVNAGACTQYFYLKPKALKLSEDIEKWYCQSILFRIEIQHTWTSCVYVCIAAQQVSSDTDKYRK